MSVFTALILVTIAPNLLGSAPAHCALPKAGIEFELATASEMVTSPEMLDSRYFTDPLKAVSRAYRDQRPFLIDRKKNYKWSFLNAYNYYYETPSGETWTVVSERIMIPDNHDNVNGKWHLAVPPDLNWAGGFDGIELITPPLTTRHDVFVARDVALELLSSGMYEVGIQSSMHVTVDASHLVDAETGNAKKLRDTIIFIENHVLEIFSAISPKRYGTIVNGFAVPIALDQKLLLQELSEIPAHHCTREAIRNVFKKFEQIELDKFGGYAHRAWKYRYANYKKILGLDDNQYLDVIEFRIPDLTLANVKRLPEIVSFFQTIVQNAALVEPGAPFQNPFGSVSYDPKQNDFTLANTAILQTPDSKYLNFLRSLGLSEETYPKLSEIQDGAKYIADAQRQFESSASSHDQASSPQLRDGLFKAVLDYNLKYEHQAQLQVQQVTALNRFIKSSGYLNLPSSPFNLIADHQLSTLDAMRVKNANFNLVYRVNRLLLTDSRKHFERLTVAEQIERGKRVLKAWIDEVGSNLIGQRDSLQCKSFLTRRRSASHFCSNQTCSGMN